MLVAVGSVTVVLVDIFVVIDDIDIDSSGGGSIATTAAAAAGGTVIVFMYWTWDESEFET